MFFPQGVSSFDTALSPSLLGLPLCGDAKNDAKNDAHKLASVMVDSAASGAPFRRVIDPQQFPQTASVFVHCVQMPHDRLDFGGHIHLKSRKSPRVCRVLSRSRSQSWALSKHHHATCLISARMFLSCLFRFLRKTSTDIRTRPRWSGTCGTAPTWRRETPTCRRSLLTARRRCERGVLHDDCKAPHRPGFICLVATC